MLDENSAMLLKQVRSPQFQISNFPVRLANRLKALSMTAYSSDEDEEDSPTAHGSEHGIKKTTSSNGGAFAEVVRAALRAKEEEAIAAAAGGSKDSKTV
jgi:hypothetical protein